MAEKSRGFGVAAGLDPEIATPLATRCEELGYGSVWSNDTPMAEGLETARRLRRGHEHGRPRRRRHRDRPPHAGRNRIEDRGARPAARAPLAGSRRRLLEEAPDRDARAPARASRRARRHPPRPRRDGPEDVRLRRRRVRRRLLQLDDPRVRRRRAQARREGRLRGRARHAARHGLRPHRRSATTPSRASPRKSRFYRELHDGYKNHFERLGEEVGTVGVAEPDSAAAQRQLAEFDALDITVVRGLASANLEAMSALAENAAPQHGA